MIVMMSPRVEIGDDNLLFILKYILRLAFYTDMEFCASAWALLAEEFCQIVEIFVEFLKTRLWK